MTDSVETQPDSKGHAVLRWVLLAAGVIAIIAYTVLRPDVAVRPAVPSRAAAPVANVDPSALAEPAPLIFQPDIAPAVAEIINAERLDYAGPIVRAKPLIAPRSLTSSTKKRPGSSRANTTPRISPMPPPLRNDSTGWTATRTALSHAKNLSTTAGRN